MKSGKKVGKECGVRKRSPKVKQTSNKNIERKSITTKEYYNKIWATVSVKDPVTNALSITV